MTFRIIPRLEIKNKNLIKGKKMEGLKKIGNPTDYIYDYFNDGADEIFICDYSGVPVLFLLLFVF